METKSTKDIFSKVTNLLISKLEQGIIPWRQPWSDGGAPRNLVTQRPYRGLNYLLLNSLGYAHNEFLTFRQVQDLGAKVKKGAQAHLVIFWVWVDNKADEEEDMTTKKRPILRHYYVFNVSQCKNIPNRAFPSKLPVDPIDTCEAIIAAMPNCPTITHKHPEAYYNTKEDYINMPIMDLFESSEGYYSVLFHELVHSTGYTTRLNRKELMEDSKFGSDLYSVEELTAEIGSCYLSSYAGISMDELNNSVGYIQGWLKQLKSDKKFVMYACSHAQRAVDYILNIKHKEDDSQTPKQVNEYERAT